MKKNIYLVLGKSASGKDSVVKKISTMTTLNLIIPYTTRPMREGETDGVEYHFVQNDKEKDLIGKTIYHTSFGEWCYGFSKEPLDPDRSYLAIINPHQLDELKDHYSRLHNVVLLYFETDEETRIVKAIERVNMNGNDNPKKYEELCRRFVADTIDFKDYPKPGMKIVYNDYESTPFEIAEEIVYNFKLEKLELD